MTTWCRRTRQCRCGACLPLVLKACAFVSSPICVCLLQYQLYDTCAIASLRLMVPPSLCSIITNSEDTAVGGSSGGLGAETSGVRASDEDMKLQQALNQGASYAPSSMQQSHTGAAASFLRDMPGIVRRGPAASRVQDAAARGRKHLPPFEYISSAINSQAAVLVLVVQALRDRASCRRRCLPGTCATAVGKPVTTSAIVRRTEIRPSTFVVRRRQPASRAPSSKRTAVTMGTFCWPTAPALR